MMNFFNKTLENLKGMFNKEFFKHNPLYIGWFFIYFSLAWTMLGGSVLAFFITALLYGLSIFIAFSPFGEWLLKFLSNIRPLYTKKEREYLNPLFEEVYDQAKSQYSRLSRNIQICIIDSMTINACAIGSCTVAVTKGAIETLNEDELKGIIGHELAHIAHGDTKAILLTTIGNGLFSVFVLILKAVMLLFDVILNGVGESGLMRITTLIIRFFFWIMLFAFSLFSEIILSINSRKNEYSADEYSHKLGYGDDLKEALYLLQKISLGDNSSIVQKLTKSHPHIAKRIGRLEGLLGT